MCWPSCKAGWLRLSVRCAAQLYDPRHTHLQGQSSARAGGARFVTVPLHLCDRSQPSGPRNMLFDKVDPRQSDVIADLGHRMHINV
jgi:hypothetical protein